MSQQDKALAKLCRKPPPRDFRWIELVALMEGLGFRLENGNGSRRQFIRDADGRSLRFNTHEPHPSGIIKTYVIKELQNWLTQVGLI